MSGVLKNRETYEHIDPEFVGNRQRVLVSDLAGRSNVIYKGKEYGIDLKGHDEAVHRILRRTKELESQGYEFEAAEASFELLIQEALERKKKNFRLLGFRVIDKREKRESRRCQRRRSWWRWTAKWNTRRPWAMDP